MKLTDKAFYKKKAEKQPSPAPKLLSAEDLFDVIMHEARRADMFDGANVDYMALAREIVNFTGLGNSQDSTRAVMEAVQQNPGVDPDKLMKIVQQLGQAQRRLPAQPAPAAPAAPQAAGFDQESQMGGPAMPPQPGMPQVEMPVQDKITQMKDMGLNDQQVEQVMKISSDDVNNPAGTATNPMDGHRDTLSQELIPGTGKIGQAAPPAAPAPGGPPSPPAAPGAPGTAPDGIGMDPGLVEEKKEDPRGLQEILDELKDDVEVITQKIEDGETMSGGQELSPITTDTGSEPAPAPMIAEKEAVDQNAKDYYKGYYGEYGEQLAEDRVAEIVDLVDETAGHYQAELSHQQVTRIAALVSASGGEGHPDFTRVLDQALVNYLFKTGMVAHELPDDARFASAMRSTALKNLPAQIQTKVAEFQKHALPKMKSPSVKGQSDDAVDVDHGSDKAEDGEHTLARPAHLHFELEDQEVKGAYLKLHLSWDPDDAAAAQSDAGLMQAARSYVKGMESRKEFIDYGFMGQISFDEFDPEAGLAVASVRTQKPGDAMKEIKTTKEAQTEKPSAGSL